MDPMILERLSVITPEERRILDGQMQIDRTLYMDGSRDIITGSPSCDTYVFDTPRGEMMMPALRRVIRSVDVDAGVMVLDGEALGEVAFWQDGETETV